MGFLDDLKRQASDLRQSHDGSQTDRTRRLQLVEAAARDLRKYLMELAAQLDVIRPAPKVRYVIDRQFVLDGLPRTGFRFDARRKIVQEQEVIDHVVMACRVGDGRRLTLAKDFVNEIERLEARLVQAGAPNEREAVRDPQHGKLAEMRYDVAAEVQVSVLVQCRHDEGLLHFTLRNLDGLESIVCDFPAHALDQARLDELARWWVGEPNRFLAGALDLRRIEPR